jgi:hypothetical protein
MAYKTVKIRAYLNVNDEYVANAALTPGHLIELMSTGYVRKHAGAGQNGYCFCCRRSGSVLDTYKG